jgi:aspartate-semialdehyde dehydrogenase
VDWGDLRVPVESLDEDVVEDLDLLVLAAPSDVSGPIGSAALRAGIPVVDASGSLARSGAAPLLVPWVNPEVLIQSAGAVALPRPATTLLASVLGPLARAGIGGMVSATVLEPASTAGRSGIEELSDQVVALLNGGTPRRRLFPEGLAFDLGPVEGLIGDDGWTDSEVDIARELREIVPGSDDPAVTTLRVPLFSGLSATIRIGVEQNLLPQLVCRILEDGGVKVAGEGRREVPRPRRVEGQPFAHVGRVRVSRDGDALHLWAAMDNLHTSATAAVSAGGALLRRRG